jgi:hypothetical protein
MLQFFWTNRAVAMRCSSHILLTFFNSFCVCVHIFQNNNMPGMDLTGEIWVETKASEGKSYFYNARTRETTWTKPEGPAVKIITQEQVLVS